MLKKTNPLPTLPLYSKVKVPKDKKLKQGNEASFVSYLFSRKSVLARLCCSLLPPIGPFKPASKDFEGTALSIFLLTCIMFHRTGRPGNYFSLMLPSCYVGGFSVIMSVISNMTGTRVTIRELVCTCGYGLFGHTVTLLASQFSDDLFIPCLIFFGGLSSVRICGILFLRTRVPGLVFITCTPAAIMHTTFPMYLHIISNQN